MQEMCEVLPLVHWLGVQGKLGCAFGHKPEEAGPLQGLRKTWGQWVDTGRLKSVGYLQLLFSCSVASDSLRPHGL